MKKILSLLLVGAMAVSMIPAAYATNTVTNESEGNATTAVTFTANDEANEEWRLTVPASMEANSSAYVVLEGTWASNKTLKVTADESVDMVSQIDGETTKNIAITFAGISLAGDNDAEVSNKTTENPNGEAIAIAAMPADALFGEWAGTFEYYVEFDDGIAPTVMFYDVKYHVVQNTGATTDMMFTSSGEYWAYGGNFGEDGSKMGTYTTEGQDLYWCGSKMGTFSDDGYTYTTIPGTDGTVSIYQYTP